MNRETNLTRRLYSTCAQEEWGRLVSDPFHRLEFDETLRFLRKHLSAKGLVLDAGGGPGRYTIELAQKGYEVVLLDLVDENLKIAKRQISRRGLGRKVKGLIEGSVTDLSRFADNSFDAVLCLGGPLSHVHPASARKRAVAELVRVAKRNAPVFISVMSRYGVMLATPAGWPRELLYKKHYDNLAFNGDDYKFRGNAYCHFFTSAELKALVSTQNVKLLDLVGLEGLNVDKETTIRFAKKFPQAWRNWMALHRKLCSDPFFVDASGHMLIVVQKRA
jgi:ubiquinone/menaquinone biosynthesis C-methylase UbiE